MLCSARELGLGSDTALVTVTVNSVNDAPSFTKGGDQIVLYDEKAHCFGLTSRGHGYLQTFGTLAVAPRAAAPRPATPGD